MNLLMSGAIMFSGASPSKVLNIFKFLNLQMVAGRTYARFQKSFVLPAISNVWERTQREILRECRGRPIKVGVDARCCFPGHSAKYGCYTIMDLQIWLVLAVDLMQSNEVKNSNAMELEGLKRALRRIDDSGVSITDITTIRHIQVKRYLREEQKTINHWFDGWHFAKHMKKQLSNLGKKKGCEIISQWTQSISNHLYYCAASSSGDGNAVEQKWMSIVNHVTNKHEGHGEKFPYCLHGPIDRNWIKADSKAHKELELLISKRRLMNGIRKLSPAKQTSQLESQHKVVCQFAQKFVSFSYPGMRQRLHLAALHTCCNADRVQAVNKDGQLRFKLSYPKHKAGHHVLKLVKENCSFEYVATLLDELIILRQKYNSHREAQEESSRHLQSQPPLTSTEFCCFEDHEGQWRIRNIVAILSRLSNELCYQ